MNTKFKSIALGLVLLAPISFVGAQSNTATQTNRPAVKAIREEVKERIASSTERVQEKLSQLRDVFMKIARYRIQNVINRMDATISREESISLRIISRIEKIKSTGGNTAEAEKFVSEAKVRLQEARTALTSLKNATSTAAENLVESNISTSTSAKNGLKKLKDMTLTIEQKLREAHQLLVKAVVSLKGSSTVTATTTPSSNN